MSAPRFLAAAAAGAVLSLWLAFFTVAYSATGAILWDGQAHDGFDATYFALLYGPPPLALLLAFLALRKRRMNSNA